MLPEGLRAFQLDHRGDLLNFFKPWLRAPQPDLISDSFVRSQVNALRFLAASQELGRGDERRLAVLASLYVHIMIRRFVPSLATELHLTIRLLHVHSEVVRGGIPTDRALKSEQERLEDPSSSHISAGSPPTAETRLKEMDDTPELKVVFRTGLDCRQFAANVLLGLKSLLPHVGADTLDLLAGSLVLASQVKNISYGYLSLFFCWEYYLLSANPRLPCTFASFAPRICMHSVSTVLNMSSLETLSRNCAMPWVKRKATASKLMATTKTPMTQQSYKAWGHRLLLFSGGRKTRSTISGAWTCRIDIIFSF